MEVCGGMMMMMEEEEEVQQYPAAAPPLLLRFFTLCLLSISVTKDSVSPSAGVSAPGGFGSAPTGLVLMVQLHQFSQYEVGNLLITLTTSSSSCHLLADAMEAGTSDLLRGGKFDVEYNVFSL